MSTINQELNQRVQGIIAEQNGVIMERYEVINGLWVAAVAQEHLVMLGPGGTGKTLLVHDMFSHITGARTFETMFHETTDPSQVYGSTNVKALVETGKTQIVIEEMLPWADIAFLDEIMNANGPIKHSLHSVMNERVFHNPGPVNVPLRFLLSGTNKNNVDTDPDLAPFFDRIHLRFMVNYLKQRDNQAVMVSQAITRMSQIGRGTGTGMATAPLTISLAELDAAHKEALALEVDSDVMNLFLDVAEELNQNGIVISDRRMVEGMAAVLANAWLRNHPVVKSGDLDILTSMWWSLQEHATDARKIILSATNPTEKIALDLLDTLDTMRADIAQVNAEMDPSRKRNLGVESIRNADKILREAAENKAIAQTSGSDTRRLDEVIAKTEEFKVLVSERLFGLNPNALASLSRANA